MLLSEGSDGYPGRLTNRRLPENEKKKVFAMWLRVLFAVGVLSGLTISAHAQNAKPEMEPFAATGTIEAIARGKVQILTNTDQQWLVEIVPQADIKVTGTAKVDFLRPGMFVKLTAEFDKRGKAAEPVGHLILFTPSQQEMIGVWPEGAAPSADAEDQFGGADAAAPPTNNRRDQGAGRYTIHGRLTGNRKGKWTVNAGTATVEFKLTEEPTIDVAIADYSVAKKGDKISIKRGRMFAGRMGFARARKLTIELSEPLTLEKKKSSRRRKPTSKRSSKKPKKEEKPAEGFGETDE